MSPAEAAERSIAADQARGDGAIWIHRLPDAVVRARADALEREGPRGRPLWGRTYAVKDNIDIAGLPTTAACPAFAYVPRETATAVQRLEDAGALLLGKTNLDQFATGLAGVRSPYGVPRNVFDPLRVPGGSSSGSAVAVAAGIVDLALGTDTAGSGRVPAMFGGIVGLKPTVGSVPSIGVVPACRSLDTVSVFSHDVASGLEALRVAAGFDAADPYSRAAPFPHLRPGAFAGRVAVADVAHLCDPAVATAYAGAAALFETETIDLGPFLDVARLLYEGPWVAERTSALRAVLQDMPEAMHPVTRAIVGGGWSRGAVDTFDALHRIRQARHLARQIFGRVDALLLPTAPFTPTLADLAADPIGPNARLGVFTNFVNLCDLAAVAVPAGMGGDGLPAGVTVIGPAWSDGRLASIAALIHARFGGPAAIGPDHLAPDETALFCIGAHMAGLPLNPQLLGLGARLLRTAHTTPGYRCYAIGARPGLIRDGSGVIAGEVWALPTAAIGALLAAVPSPLGFGTVLLEDGPCLGFLAEHAGVVGAPEITALGGWRAWLAIRPSA